MQVSTDEGTLQGLRLQTHCGPPCLPWLRGAYAAVTVEQPSTNSNCHLPRFGLGWERSTNLFQREMLWAAALAVAGAESQATLSKVDELKRELQKLISLLLAILAAVAALVYFVRAKISSPAPAPVAPCAAAGATFRRRSVVREQRWGRDPSLPFPPAFSPPTATCAPSLSPQTTSRGPNQGARASAGQVGGGGIQLHDLHAMPALSICTPCGSAMRGGQEEGCGSLQTCRLVELHNRPVSLPCLPGDAGVWVLWALGLYAQWSKGLYWVSGVTAQLIRVWKVCACVCARVCGCVGYRFTPSAR